MLALAALSAALLAPAAPPAAAAPLTATRIRVGEHPGFVRVVVDFSGGRVEAGEVVATDPDPFRDGVVRLPLTRAGVRTTAAPVQADGVSARVSQGARRIIVRLGTERRRFKYVGYRALHGPERLAIDLYQSAPPSRAAEVRRAPDGCLSLRRFSVSERRVSAGGRERDLFEHSLVVRLRRADGRVQAERPETAARRRWSTRLRYPRAPRQTGTLEAVAESAKDGTLDCLVQVRVRLGSSP
jgi:Immunoglobulin-like domain of bacterial spore germination